MLVWCAPLDRVVSVTVITVLVMIVATVVAHMLGVFVDPKLDFDVIPVLDVIVGNLL